MTQTSIDRAIAICRREALSHAGPVSARFAAALHRMCGIHRRRTASGLPVHHLPRRAARISTAYLTALASER